MSLQIVKSLGTAQLLLLFIWEVAEPTEEGRSATCVEGDGLS